MQKNHQSVWLFGMVLVFMLASSCSPRVPSLPTVPATGISPSSTPGTQAPSSNPITPAPSSTPLPAWPTALVPRNVSASLTCLEKSVITVKNADFEQGWNMPAGWTANNSSGYTFALVTDRKHAGLASAYIRSLSNAPLDFPNFGQVIPLAQFTGALQLGAWVSTRGVEGPYGVYIAINYLDASGQRITWSQSNEMITGDTDWTYLTAEGNIPVGTRSIAIGLLLDSHGEVWFDSVTLAQYTLLPQTAPAESAFTLTDTVLQGQFFGFGVQNNPFLYYGPDNPAITEDDINLVESRITQLQPRHVRIFFDTRWRDTGSAGSGMLQAFLRDLSLYQKIGSDIDLVMWQPNDWSEKDFPTLVTSVKDLLQYLIRDQGITRIKYLTLYNEPDFEFKLPLESYIQLNKMMVEALGAANLPVQLVGADEGSSVPFFQSVVPPLAPLANVFSYHNYPSYKDVYAFVLRASEHLQYVTTSGAGKPLFLWEFNVTGPNSGIFSPGEITPGVLVIDKFDSALSLAQDALYGMNMGIAGISYWEVYDMYYSGGSLMHFGLWADKGSGWRIRPIYYVYGLLTRLIQSGATVHDLAAANCDQSLPSAAVRNPDGTFSVYIINPWKTEVSVKISGLADGWKARKYLLTEALAADLSGKNAIFPPSSEISQNSGVLVDRLPPVSMVVYSDAP
jgi:hypothetical protein